MKKLCVMFILLGVLMLSACNSASIKARDHLYGYLETGDFFYDIYQQDESLFEDVQFGGFSNFGYASEDYLELMYLRDDTSAVVRYHYDYDVLDSGMIELTIESVQIDYRNIDTHEYLRISQIDINDTYTFTEDEFDAFNVMLYELRLKDILWILDALGYELL